MNKIFKSVMVVSSILLTFLVTIAGFNILKIFLLFHNWNSYLLSIFDNSYSNNPLIYLMWGILSLVLLWLGTQINIYLESSQKAKKKRVYQRVYR
jgi:hypothetical protein